MKPIRLTFVLIKIVALFILALPAKAGQELYFDKLANAIYRAEGGRKTDWPYGIKVHVHNPRKVCIKLCRAVWQEWILVGSKADYLDYLSEIYCPSVLDPVGNKNWRKNVKYFMRQSVDVWR